MGNDYPDCYDPIYQAERREDEWERWLQDHAEEGDCEDV